MAEDALPHEALAQFLRDCEPPTPPASVPSTVPAKFPHPISSCPQSSTAGLRIDEDEVQAILSALDAFDDVTENCPAPVRNLSDVESFHTRLPQLTMDESDFMTVEKASALKLSMQKAKANKRRTRHRQRVKAEWQMLRLQNDQLSARLQELKRARACVGGTGVSDLQWQAVAAKELTARLQAKGEQQHIRMEIERRSKTMQKLEDLWSQYIASREEPQQEWGQDDFELYKNFILEVGMAYARTDIVMHDSGLGETEPSNTSYYSPTLKWDSLRGYEYFESTSAFVMPSKYPKSANVMFDSMRQVHRENPRRGLHEDVKDPLNTIAVKFDTIFHCEAGNVVLLSLFLVMQRFVEPGRTILVWRGLLEGDREFAGTYLSHTGWIVLRPSTAHSTDVRTCVHTVPTRLNVAKSIEGSELHVRRFVDITMRSSQSDKLKLARLMEKLLLEDDNQSIAAV
ncbi:hypothetical protein PHYBOEH_007975 [Phytophthora boehmeriae]|uniref:M96 mating-specific protein family n=1 Tax=Phytophthora boehmeriae TaxID=109152 RepID=A0A8T1W950_9STRA|nr:hypothetical protein PHYBOEH_007975 [Phytophthora boehmeriae]